MKKFILIKDISVQNANAFSSVYTAGYPGITSFLGFSHKLQRDINEVEDFTNVKFLGLGVFSKDFTIQCYRENKYSNYKTCLRRHPLSVKNKQVTSAAIIEEIYCDLTFSLLIEYTGIRSFENEDVIKILNKSLNINKFSGGDILSFNEKIEFIVFDEDEDLFNKKIGNKVMVSYALIDRHDLLEKDNSENSIKDLISYLQINCKCQEINNEVEWNYSKRENGWFVPIPVGFIGITDLKNGLEQRNEKYQHRFVEPVITLAEFKLAYRINCVSDLLWYYDYDEENKLYICKNKKGEENE